MATISFACVSCGTRSRSPASMAGMRAACPACGRQQTVPGGGEVVTGSPGDLEVIHTPEHAFQAAIGAARTEALASAEGWWKRARSAPRFWLMAYLAPVGLYLTMIEFALPWQFYLIVGPGMWAPIVIPMLWGLALWATWRSVVHYERVNVFHVLAAAAFIAALADQKLPPRDLVHLFAGASVACLCTAGIINAIRDGQRTRSRRPGEPMGTAPQSITRSPAARSLRS